MRKCEVAIQISEHEYDTSIKYSVDPTACLGSGELLKSKVGIMKLHILDYAIPAKSHRWQVISVVAIIVAIVLAVSYNRKSWMTGI